MMIFVCPACNHVQTCPCPSCQKRSPTEKPWKWDGDFVSCGGCDMKQHSDWWMDEEYRQVKEWEKSNGSTETN